MEEAPVWQVPTKYYRAHLVSTLLDSHHSEITEEEEEEANFTNQPATLVAKFIHPDARDLLISQRPYLLSPRDSLVTHTQLVLLLVAATQSIFALKMHLH